MNKTALILGCVLMGFSQFSNAQIKEEKLVLDRKRVPEVKRIEKKKSSVETIKNYPPKEKKIQDSLHLKYTITDVPAVSDYKTSEIKGMDISPKFNADYQNNYVQLGIGNYGKIVGDANVSTVLENKTEIGVDAHFLSTEGLKKKYNWDSQQSLANIGVFLNSYSETGKLNLTADYQGQNYNYYGIYALSPASDVDLKQKTNEIAVKGFYEFYDNQILKNAALKAQFLSDHYDAKENLYNAYVNFGNFQTQLKNDFDFSAGLRAGINGHQTSFDILNKTVANNTVLNFEPHLKFSKGENYLMIGSDFSFLNSKYESQILPEEKLNAKFYWFPKVELQISAVNGFKFYGGVDGGLQVNSYAELLKENPFLVSDQLLKPTQTKYHLYFGLKGDVGELMKYDVSAGFAKANNIMYFRANNLFDVDAFAPRKAYDYANTFSAAYDNGSISQVKGSVQFFPLEGLKVEAEAEFTKYKLDNVSDILNKPLLKANIGAKYAMLNKKLLLGFKTYFVTDRTTNSYTLTIDSLNPNVYQSIENTNEKVGGYADINLSAEYKIHKNFSIFAVGNNLFNANYKTYKAYQVLGAQVLGGVKISF